MVKTGQFTTKYKVDSHAKNHTCCELTVARNKWPF